MGKIDVACPGFAVDCLETLEEIAMQNAERFRAAGGGELRYIPALNTRDDHSTFLSRLIADDAGADT
jgi:ferrochelatase